jgi:hypothetical protein
VAANPLAISASKLLETRRLLLVPASPHQSSDGPTDGKSTVPSNKQEEDLWQLLAKALFEMPNRTASDPVISRPARHLLKQSGNPRTSWSLFLASRVGIRSQVLRLLSVYQQGTGGTLHQALSDGLVSATNFEALTDFAIQVFVMQQMQRAGLWSVTSVCRLVARAHKALTDQGGVKAFEEALQAEVDSEKALAQSKACEKILTCRETSEGGASQGSQSSLALFEDNSSVSRAPSSAFDYSALCAICLERRVGIKLNPCRHVCLCPTCADELHGTTSYICPLCRSHISSREEVYLA